MNFLIVDDLDTVGRNVIDALRKISLEYTVIVCDNSKEAFSKMKLAGFNLIVNLDMKNGESEKFIQKIKGNKVLSKKKILAITSFPEKYKHRLEEMIIISFFNKEKLIEELKILEKK